MRSRRALWSLIFPVLAGAVALALLPPSPPARASQEAPPSAPISINCAAPLPLPSELLFEKSEYERILGRFLRAGCYEALHWHHDAQIRPTGPTVAALGGRSPCSEVGHHHAGHPYHGRRLLLAGRLSLDVRAGRGARAPVRRRVPQDLPDLQARARPAGAADRRRLDDPQADVWQHHGASACEDPAIPKEEPNIIALMVRDSRGGKDGWYWGSWDPQATEASQLDWPPPANLPYPWMGFGYYCVNCHASAKDEFTFSSAQQRPRRSRHVHEVLLPGPAAHRRRAEPPQPAMRDDLRP